MLAPGPLPGPFDRVSLPLVSSTTVTEFHRALNPRGYWSLWREGSATAPPGHGPRHRNPGFELTWVREGFVSFALEAERDAISVKTGGAIVLTPDELNTPFAAGTLFQLMLAPSLLEAARSQLAASALPSSALAFAPGSRVSTLTSLIARERRALDDGDPLVSSLADALVMAIVRPEAPEPRRLDAQIKRAIEFLDAHHAERVSVEDVARVTGLPRFVLMRRFKAQTGSSLYRHLQNVRLDRAAHALRTTAGTVLEVALDSGFSDPGRFARAFRLRFGQGPASFRARFA